MIYYLLLFNLCSIDYITDAVKFVKTHNPLAKLMYPYGGRKVVESSKGNEKKL